MLLFLFPEGFASAVSREEEDRGCSSRFSSSSVFATGDGGRDCNDILPSASSSWLKDIDDDVLIFSIASDITTEQAVMLWIILILEEALFTEDSAERGIVPRGEVAAANKQSRTAVAIQPPIS